MSSPRRRVGCCGEATIPTPCDAPCLLRGVRVLDAEPQSSLSFPGDLAGTSRPAIRCWPALFPTASSRALAAVRASPGRCTRAAWFEIFSTTCSSAGHRGRWPTTLHGSFPCTAGRDLLPGNPVRGYCHSISMLEMPQPEWTLLTRQQPWAVLEGCMCFARRPTRAHLPRVPFPLLMRVPTLHATKYIGATCEQSGAGSARRWTNLHLERMLLGGQPMFATGHLAQVAAASG